MNYLITGGAGFIGCNSAEHFLKQGHHVTIFDNLSRPGSRLNLDWLYTQFSNDRLHFIQADIRDYDALAKAMPNSDVVIHLAGQVAVTTSVQNPRHDFETNALGTFNVLEALRLHAPHAVFLYASTNKVYGGMTQVGISEGATRYHYSDHPHGIPETFPLDFHSPYGCSKGTGDQYTLDYARIYGLKTMALRQSCIYGKRQFGVEDQGWVAHFVIAAQNKRPIAIYGDGKQARDLLHISDLIHAYELAIAKAPQLAGTAFNLGGGSQNVISIWREFEPLLTQLTGYPIPATFSDWRPGDQRVFVADIRRAKKLLGWQPTVSPQQGIAQLYHWVAANPTLFTAAEKPPLSRDPC